MLLLLSYVVSLSMNESQHRIKAAEGDVAVGGGGGGEGSGVETGLETAKL